MELGGGNVNTELVFTFLRDFLIQWGPPSNWVWVLVGCFGFFSSKILPLPPWARGADVAKKLDSKCRIFKNQPCNKKSTFPVVKPKIMRGSNETIEQMYCTGEGPIGFLKSPLKRSCGSKQSLLSPLPPASSLLWSRQGEGEGRASKWGYWRLTLDNPANFQTAKA